MATKKTTTTPRATVAPKKKRASAKAKPRSPRVAGTRSPKKLAAPRLFRIEKQTTPFMTTRTSRETVYWVILGVVVIAFTAWIMKLQSDIQAIYDNIDITNSTVLDMSTNEHAAMKKHAKD